ncbi:hypothetical protein GALMADRAFT_59488 [Galerina marginata CBS 339.88]|uniref:Transcription factor TFIIB cyclin-like domain-containing protein n=1 Tax=Galerina marginata (strain CBS 339.88) TaxID=685588 RepID=A0A067TEX1_GALM3|nr:hypothetical protein GALMADRAFT_59488 [Galerina marginata CBS 339.88]
MSVRCTQCGASTTWDDDVGSAVCTSCGSLVDPSQSVLTSSLYGHQNDTSEPSLWDSSASTTLKSFRVGNNWDLAGQGKESRDRKNAVSTLAMLLTNPQLFGFQSHPLSLRSPCPTITYAMVEFIKSLAVSFNAPGLSPRAINLFNQVKAASNFRWGQKSRSVAAACLSIALRESNRPDSLRDIASVLNVPPTSVIREFTYISSTLNLTSSLIDPSVHISTLQAHITSVLKEQHREPRLPDILVKSLRTLCLRSVANTATSLSEVLARVSPDHDVLRLPVAPTACGIFLLALEAENRAVMNPLGDLAQCLGTRCHVSKAVVMARYKTIQDEVASWVEKVPWLDKYDSKKGRAKVPKRLVVARGLKDVIQFQEDIWQQQPMPSLELELTEDERKEDQCQSSQSLELASHPPKRRKLNHAVAQATQFLLNPLGTPVTISSNQKNLPSTASSYLPLATYILTNPSTSVTYKPPTRLQLLALDRGGVQENQIPDDELFAEGEFESLLRGADEVQMLRNLFGWKEGEDQSEADKTLATKRKRKTKSEEDALAEDDDIIRGTALSPRKKSRLNMEALAQFMDGHNDDDLFQVGGLDSSLMGLEEVIHSSDVDINDAPYDNFSMDDNVSITVQTPPPTRRRRSNMMRNTEEVDADEEVVIDGWRPPTPDHRAAYSRYEEEYD